MVDRYRAGDWLAICDRCGLETYGSELIDDVYQPGLKVHRWCMDTRNPQDFIRPRPEIINPPWARPEVIEEPTVITSTPYVGLTDELDLIFNCTSNSISASLPTHNNVDFNGAVVCYNISREDDGSSNTLTITSVSIISGDVTLLPGEQALFQNGASGWTRIA